MTQTSPTRQTFRVRLAVSAMLLCLGILTLAGIIIYLGVWQALQRSVDDVLLRIARTESASAMDGPGGALHVHDESPIATASGYDKFVQILDTSGRVLAATDNLTQGTPLHIDLAAMQQARAGQIAYADTSRDGTAYRTIYYPFQVAADSPLIMICAVPKRPVQKSLQALLWTLVVALLLSGGIAVWGASHLARRLTRPLEDIAAAAHAIEAPPQERRLPVVSQDKELYDLTAILNQMLERLGEAFSTQQRLLAAQRRFVGDASHELRSPLTNLRGTVEVALRRPRSVAEYHETLTACLTEIVRLSQLVDDLLTLSRADAGQFTFHFTPCDITAVVQQAMAAHAARAEELRVSVRLQEQSQPGIVLVSGDMLRLRQAVDNLLDNALRYAPPGSVVEVTVGQEDETARISVRDSGAGLDAAEHERIFDRFYRADPSRTRATGGLGLGLAIVKAIVEAHGGTVAVQSTPGTGALFSVSLPVAASALSPDAKKNRAQVLDRAHGVSEPCQSRQQE